MPTAPENKSSPPKKPRPSPVPNRSTWWLLVALAIVLAIVYYSNKASNRSEISYGMFRSQLDKNNIERVDIQESRVIGEFKKPPPDPEAKPEAGAPAPLLKPQFETSLPPMARSDPALDQFLRAKLDGRYNASEPVDKTFWVVAFPVLLSVALFVGVVFMFRKARDSFFTGGLTGGFTKSGARRYEQGDRPITFADVAGLEGVKNELQEIVEFLRDPAKFQRLGARVPKGVLLMGPPGTGKTLLGRAVAGEAGVPFFSINGSEFIQMFVGVGAGRVRDLFNTAKESAAGHPLHRRNRRRRSPPRRRHRRRSRRTRTNLEPDPQRDGRLHANRIGHRHGRHQPA